MLPIQHKQKFLVHPQSFTNIHHLISATVYQFANALMVLIILAALALVLLVAGFASIFRTDIKLLVDAATAESKGRPKDRPSRQPEHGHRASRDRQHNGDPRDYLDDEFFFAPRRHILDSDGEKSSSRDV